MAFGLSDFRCIKAIKKILKLARGIPFAQNCAIALKIMLRKFPDKFEYDSEMENLFWLLLDFKDDEAKASLVWIIGEYAEKIENSEETLATVAEK